MCGLFDRNAARRAVFSSRTEAVLCRKAVRSFSAALRRSCCRKSVRSFSRTQAVFYSPPEGGAQPCCAVECSEGRLPSLGVDVAAALWSSLEVTATPGASFVARLGCLYPVGGLRGTGAEASGVEQREGRLVVIISFLPARQTARRQSVCRAVPCTTSRARNGTTAPSESSTRCAPFFAPQNEAAFIAAAFRALGRGRAVALLRSTLLPRHRS